jgi:hypothetical protein
VTYDARHDYEQSYALVTALLRSRLRIVRAIAARAEGGRLAAPPAQEEIERLRRENSDLRRWLRWKFKRLPTKARAQRCRARKQA